MLKKLFLCAMVVFLLAVSGWSSAPITTLSKFGERVREITEIEDLDLLPDDVLYDICNEAIVWTSCDIGGVESEYSFVTEADVSRYGLPDSTVEVLFSLIYTQSGKVKGIRAWFPQYFSQISEKPVEILKGDTLDVDLIPVAYQYWGDSIKLMPTPARGDTIYLDIYVEHPVLDTLTNTLIIFQSYSYTDAALSLACANVFKMVKQYDPANYFKNEYDIKRTQLKEAQARRIEISITGK